MSEQRKASACYPVARAKINDSCRKVWVIYLCGFSLTCNCPKSELGVSARSERRSNEPKAKRVLSDQDFINDEALFQIYRSDCGRYLPTIWMRAGLTSLNTIHCWAKAALCSAEVCRTNGRASASGGYETATAFPYSLSQFAGPGLGIPGMIS